MPIISFHCDRCQNNFSAFFRHPKDAGSIAVCSKCKGDARKVLKAPSSTSKVTVDNGFQARATEVNLEVIEDIKGRSTKNFKE